MAVDLVDDDNPDAMIPALWQWQQVREELPCPKEEAVEREQLAKAEARRAESAAAHRLQLVR